jgi:hypothetical protein
MTDQQHRATPEQWELVKYYADVDHHLDSCVLELRDRIAALEAAQLDQAESHRFCTDAIVRRVEALEAAPTFRVLETGEPIRMNIVQDEASGQNILVPPSAPADSLVERVAIAMRCAPNCDDESWETEARAAIREVARWLRSELVSRAVADRLDYEAER